MRLKTILDTSTINIFAKELKSKYRYFKRLFWRASESSFIYRRILKFWYALKICFRYSFLGRVSEANKRDAPFIISESQVIRRIKDLCDKLKKDFSFYFNTSILNKLKKEFKNEFYAYPLKVISTVIIVSTLTNIFLTILLKKELTILGWIIRTLFLFAGLASLNSNTDWQAIKNDSIILQVIFRKKCAGFAEK